MTKCIDLTGKRFGRLVVIKRVENYVSPNGSKYARWLCRCDCGKEKVVKTVCLNDGDTQSCGCIHSERLAERNRANKKLGKTNHRLYKIWCGIKARCKNSNATDYDIYGGRGITICEEWKNDFSLFYNWAVNNGYKDNLTIDRVDTNGNYCPENCKWSTTKEQSNNKRNNKYITYKGQTKTLSQWCDELGLKYSKIKQRIQSGNWSVERAFTTH